jgi:hypothetical protein
MNRKTLLAFFTFAVLGALAIFALTRPEKGEVTAAARPLPPLDPAQIDTLEVTKAGATTVIKSEGGKYKVTAPVAYAADEPVAKAAFEGLGKLELSSLVTEQKAKHAEFEVDDKGLHLVAKKGDKVLADLVIGKSVGPGTMVRLSGKDDVWQATGLSRYAFDKGPADWRDKSITTYTAGDAERIDVAAKDGAKIALKKSGTKEGSAEKWEVVESSLKVEKLDNDVPNGIASALASWKANDFADGTTAAAAGLEPPALTVTVSLKGGKKAVVLVGNKKGDDERYVKAADAPQVFVVKKYNLDRVARQPLDFRDKTLCDLPETNLAEVAVTHGAESYTLVKSGNDWKATKPAKLEVDSAKVTPIAGGFKDWKATTYAEDQSPKANGLDKPKAVIAVKAKDKGHPGCTIRVGDETKDKLSYAVSVGKATDVLFAPKWSVDRVLVKVDELKKTAAAVAKK